MKPANPELHVDVYDTTLRDGTQREGISLSCADKLRLCEALDVLGVAFVEGGWPGSNPKDAELFRRASDLPWATAKLAAFGSTRRAGAEAASDPGLRALIGSGAPVCTIFGKASPAHVEGVLRTSLDENLRMIEESVALLRSEGRRVIFDAEHFFDGAREDAAYALEALRAAVRGGAECVVLCDTNGGTMPWEVEARVRTAVALLPVTVGIHAHDDAGCAVASSLAAVRAGARHVQGTMNGYGERCGNANLTTLIADLEIKLGARCVREGALPTLARVARLVAEVANLAFDEHAPYVGRSAFAHKGGVHVAAIRRAPRSYEHVDPSRVGNRTRVVVSELAGRANVLDVAERWGLPVEAGMDAEIARRVKEEEAAGASYESAEASVALMLRREQAGYARPFELVDYKVLVGRRADEDATSDAAVKVRVRGELLHTAAEGRGPVGALDAALRKALAQVYPEVERIHLEDYKVRILDGRDGTSATTRVVIDHGDGVERWTTVGASTSIVEASMVAVVDGIEHGLWLARRERSSRLCPKGEGGGADEGHDRPLAG